MRRYVLLVLLFLVLLLTPILAPLVTFAQTPTHWIRLPLVMRAYAPHVPTSDQLIDAALGRGEIDAETALSYKVFATLSDARLPARFRGDDSKLPDSHILDVVQARYATLSPATQATLAPFLIPPIYANSWAQAPGPDLVGPQLADMPELRRDRARLDSKALGEVRVWWKTNRPGDEALADGYLAAMEGTIWPKLVGLMGRRPVSDAAQSCNGGDGLMDIYLDPRVARSCAPSNPSPGCRSTSAYILLNPSVSNDILAHEFMHVLQWGYATRDGCMYPGEYAWLAEATAVWSQDYTYPGSNEEHYVADWFFLENSAPSLEFTNDAHEYGAYLFFFYLTHRGGDNDLVRRAWAYTEGNDSLEAVNKAIPGGYEAVWPEFAVYNWNASPYDQYTRWDGQAVRAKPLFGKDEISAPGLWAMTSNVPHLGLLYKHYTFDGDDTRLVTFVNGLTYQASRKPINEQVGITTVDDESEVFQFTDLVQPLPGVKVQALYRLEGDSAWQLEDSDRPLACVVLSRCRLGAAGRAGDHHEQQRVFPPRRRGDARVSPLPDSGVAVGLLALQGRRDLSDVGPGGGRVL